MKKMDKIFPMMYELEDIEEVCEIGMRNMIDISVRGDETFHLSNGFVSHNSASAGLMPALGRKEVGYYELKGKPLNAYDKSQQAFRGNKELSELYQILQTEDYEYIIFATDQDLDGFLIRGLLIGFLNRYRNDLLVDGRVGMLQTPIMSEMKNDMPTKWIYTMEESESLSGHIKYFKGLGSWTEKGLKYVVKKDGLNKMIEFLEFDEEAQESIDSWLNKKRADDRKTLILANDFDLIKL